MSNRVINSCLQQVRKMATKSSVVAPLSNRYYLFNYFEKPSTDEATFVGRWTEVSEYVQQQEHFISTHLHQSVGPHTRFVWVNFAAFDSEDICVFGKPDPNWAKFMQRGAEEGLKPLPGQYREIASFKGNSLAADDKERPDEYRFLLTAVTADESVSCDDIESNWTSWTGTDFIQDHLKANPALGDSLLYKFIKGRNPLVRYTVRTELKNMEDSEGHAIAQLVEKQPVPKGIQTHVGFYHIHTNQRYTGKTAE